jgi:hypothetical protein
MSYLSTPNIRWYRLRLLKLLSLHGMRYLMHNFGLV